MGDIAEADLPYRSEYAKSGRSSCKACKTSIGKADLRLAAMVQVNSMLCCPPGRCLISFVALPLTITWILIFAVPHVWWQGPKLVPYKMFLYKKSSKNCRWYCTFRVIALGWPRKDQVSIRLNSLTYYLSVVFLYKSCKIQNLTSSYVWIFRKLMESVLNGGLPSGGKKQAKVASSTGTNLNDFRLEYAKSGASTCGICEEKIKKVS